ncbi:hypothetical protein DRQ16_02055 [bacterium]|nr:MAG: hypothetical protein DRQ18_04700 [bacterium]RKZ22757.1 MAG: hypothetical protein DRQ16_02055 [bacterium]
MRYFLIFLVLFPACSSQPAREAGKAYTRKVLKLPERVKVIDDLRIIRNSLELYRAEHGRYPSSLDELNLRLNYPGEYEYDKNTGKVKSKHYPSL